MTPCRTPEREARIREVLGYRQRDLTLVLANIHDPHNVSAMYRSCDAFGIPAVHLYYTTAAFPVLGEKSSASARKWVETVRHRSLRDLQSALRRDHMRVYAASCSPSAQPLWECDFTGPSAVILGNEHSGVDPELFAIADDALYIPMYGMIQSLNVSVAAAVIMAEASRQRLLAGKYDAPAYPAEELDRLAAIWREK